MPHRNRSIAHFASLLTVCACLAAGLGACTAAPAPLAPGDWLAADLLALDPPEVSLTQPLPAGEMSGMAGADLIAVYARYSLQELHLRLDLLDFSGGQAADLYLALDTAPGGTTTLPLAGASELEWDALLVIPASGELSALDSQGGALRTAGLRVARSPGSHSLAIRLDPASLPGGGASLSLQVFSALPGSWEIADQTPALNAQSPTVQPLPALLAFWDSFPASTAVQALRRWDGAHTGPFGGRHGLYNLLRTARARQVPLVLLDLSNPEVLAALDTAGGAALVSELTQSRQLSLPASLPGLLSAAGSELPLVSSNVVSDWLESSRESQLAFGLPASPLIYAPLSTAQFPTLAEALQGHPGRTIFTFSTASDSAFGNAERWGMHTLLRVPRQAAGSAPDRLDFALEARRQLAQAAWDWNINGAESNRFLTLGGSLPESPFGSPQYARLAFQYLQEHPWIRLLSGHDLQTIESGAHSRPGAEEPLTDAAIQPPHSRWGAAYLRAIYTQPYPAPAELPSLRAGYLGLLPTLEAAAAWTEHPYASVDCTADPDQDGAPECRLASEGFYALVELDDGRLVLAIARREGVARREGAASDAGGAHMLVAPGYLRASGLGDPAAWDLSAGALADPQVLAGGFGGAGSFTVEILPDGVRLTSANGMVTKEYHLAGDGLAFHLRGPEASAWQLPLVIAGQDTDFIQDGNTLHWQSGGVEFELGANLPVHLTTFRDGEALLGQPENPERDLPAGMFLPLGMAVVEWEGDELEGWLR